MSKKASDDGATRQTALPPDDKSTRMVEDSGVLAQLKARFGSGAPEEALSLYTLPDTVVVGRGSAADWQLEDDSLSRKHAQFRWNGRELTVEDLGSANGTKVNGKGVVRPEPVRAGDEVQLGTVVIRFEPRGAGPSADPDALATRLVATPAARPQDLDDDGPAPLAPIATVINKAPARGAPKPNAQVFRPPHNAARPDEPTATWDTNAVLVKQKEPSLDVRGLWHTHRRVLVLGGAAAWIAILLIVWTSLEKPPVEEDPFVGQGDKVAPLVTPLAAPVVDVVPASPEQRPQLLAQAVTAYEQGRLADSLAIWRRLATDGSDAGAVYMVKLIESRLQNRDQP